MQDETIITEFTQQAEAFNASAVARDAETLDALVRLAAPQAGERWLEAACGPGIISRNLAPRVGEVHGVDLTPAMVELARREAAQAGLGNATFAVGDATALELPTASVDGAIARFTIHHIPVPARHGGTMIGTLLSCWVGGSLRPGDADAAAWSQEIERLRDPSHWACLPLTRLRALPEQTGLKLEHEQLVAMVLDFDDSGCNAAQAGPPPVL